MTAYSVLLASAAEAAHWELDNAVAPDALQAFAGVHLLELRTYATARIAAPARRLCGETALPRRRN
jgi:hypothetical protein